jgi:hypothetical protein
MQIRNVGWSIAVSTRKTTGGTYGETLLHCEGAANPPPPALVSIILIVSGFEYEIFNVDAFSLCCETAS